MASFTIDLDKHPNLQFRIDQLQVPAAVRAEFDAAMARNLAFIERLPGFHWHLAFEQTSGSSTSNITTIAVWDSPEAIAKAQTEVRAYYERIGFEPREMFERLGITASMGNLYVPYGLR